MFRKESYRSSPNVSVGEVLLVKPLSTGICVWLVGLTVLATLLLLSVLDYSRAEPVHGTIFADSNAIDGNIHAILYVPMAAMTYVNIGDVQPIWIDGVPKSTEGPTLTATVISWSHTPVDRPIDEGLYYEVRVQLDKSSFEVGGKTFQLVHQMKLSSLIVVETRSILSWVLPSFSERNRE